MQKQRFAITIILLLTIGMFFWLGSRYPNLATKSTMTGGVKLEEFLSFDTIIPNPKGTENLKRITISFLNWANTNKKGMFFGFLFGSALLTLIPYFPFRARKSKVLNSIIGMFIGTPLGVCVNCAAPIARGLAIGGLRPETTLAAMVSSPTLNIVVVSMLLASMPFFLVAIKLGLTFFVIVAVIPFITRDNRFALQGEPVVSDLSGSSESESWVSSFFNILKEFTLNLVKIIRDTLPLMILAGILGAIVVNFLPDNFFAGESLIFLVILAIVGVFLPVPIALDIIIAQSLFLSGTPLSVVAILLFTLGSYSCYSHFIVAKSYGQKSAATLFGVFVILGLIGGLMAEAIYSWKERSLVVGPNYHEIDHNMTLTKKQIEEHKLQPLTTQWETFWKKEKVSVSGHAHNERSSGNSNTQFEKISGSKLGLTRPIEKNLLEMTVAPFSYGRGIAGGDINRDGHDDVVVATGNGVLIYLNDSKGGFINSESILLPQGENNILGLALVDTNNDGQLDIVTSSWGNGSVNSFLSQDGKFDLNRKMQIPNTNARFAQTMAFADIDRDSDLDIYLGNWYWDPRSHRPYSIAENKLIINQGNESFLERKPDHEFAETLTTLFSDINGDGLIDLMVGNDFDPPDNYYYGNGEGDFSLLKKGQAIPVSPESTMSIDTGDINNDLIPDIYMVQIGIPLGSYSVPNVDFGTDYCSSIRSKTDRKLCEQKMQTRNYLNFMKATPDHSQDCARIEDKEMSFLCQQNLLLIFGMRSKEGYCQKISEPVARGLCDDIFFKPRRGKFFPGPDDIPQRSAKNVLFIGNKKYQFKEKAKAYGVDNADWAWNAKFADLDNDSWQDIYVVNGTFYRDFVPTSVFFHNQKGKKFNTAQKEFGLENYVISSSYIYIDFDRDGDLDIIEAPVNNELVMFKNNEQENHSITFSFSDQKGNSAGVGSKIYITDESGESQMRELKASGGFLSFDPPKIHFGLGKVKSIKKIVIHWSTGETTSIDQVFRSNYHYNISRTN